MEARLKFSRICSGIYNAGQDSRHDGRIIYSIQRPSGRKSIATKSKPWVLTVVSKAHSWDIEKPTTHKTKKAAIRYAECFVAPLHDKNE